MKLLAIILQVVSCSVQEQAFENLEMIRYCKAYKHKKHDFCDRYKLDESKRQSKHFRMIFRPHRFHNHQPVCYHCNRHSFDVDAQELVDTMLAHTGKSFALYEIDGIKVNPNKIVDIGYCNGSCKFSMRHASESVRNVFYCDPVSYTPISVIDRTTGEIFEIKNAIVDSCKCKAMVHCSEK
ncbi:Oidioi.mRNA.OKI2018_I69.PAR.g11758.t1.cds [Oikopleura dioica]|uniref:Oidioi.mRNA.OKI2018_I69.PAR.g11758.t1.cds n=1 Tax=Oikopleura dioica TaxID=34765 RepID=A0ABN7RX66_OIKDI|nr:Oidioi.mRNA.OKI2018_I69.PAR.g11758.t1.cds [Oikopleura dioica]